MEKNKKVLFQSTTDFSNLSPKALRWFLMKSKNNPQHLEVLKGRVTLKTYSIEELNSYSILELLNTINCFDFPYEPKHGDLLIISEREVTMESYQEDLKNLRLIFKNNLWRFGSIED